MDKIIKEIRDKKEKSQMDKLILLGDPEVKQRIIDLRNEGTGRKWTDVAKIFNSEYKTDFGESSLKNAYEQELALTLTIEGNKEKLFSDNLDSVKKRYDRVNSATDKYQEVVDKLVNEVGDMNSYDLLENVDKLFKIGKQIEVIYKMVDKSISLLLSEQEKISIKAQKSKKEIGPAEMMKKIKEYFPEQLKSLEIQGKIKVLDKNLYG